MNVNADTSRLNVATQPSVEVQSQRRSALTELLGPVSVQTFFSAYFGRRGLHIPGSMLHRPLFSWKQLNELLNNHKGLPEGAKILTEGKEITPKDYLVLLRDIRRGLTMFFEDVDRHDPVLTAFLIRLSRELQSATRFNMYLSSPGQQGRKIHYDTHDVFVVQVEGSKHWTIYDISDPKPIYTRKNHDVETPHEPAPYLDCVLKKGDVLYLPRGHWHNVNPVDEVSLHLTLGVFVPNGIEFLLWLVDECTELEDARENVPLRIAFDTEDDYRRARRKFFDKMLGVLSGRAHTSRLLDEYEAFCLASLPNREPFNFPFSIGRHELMPDATVALVAVDYGAQMIGGGDATASIVYSNRVINVPTALVGLASHMLSGIPFTWSEVETRAATPALKAEVRSLVKTLLAEGLLRPTNQ